MVRIHHYFEWDEDKNAANIRKHKGVSFEDAVRVLSDDEGDRFHVDRPDLGRDEDRFVTLASDPADRRTVYLIVWTDRSTDDEQVTRIISARYADKKEKREYGDSIQG